MSVDAAVPPLAAQAEVDPESAASASGGVPSEEESALSAPSFHKTLSSDLSSDAAIDLLYRVHGLEPLFGELFEHADVPACNAILSVLTFQPGERIVTSGEEATFAAIVLAGSVIVQFGPTSFVELGPGMILGEMAYFERGPRSADITAKTEAVLAVISYEDLERLAEEGQADLQHKFVMLFSMHTIVKLRKTIKMEQDKAAQPAGATTPTTEPTQSNGSIPAVPPTTASPTAGAGAAGGGGPASSSPTSSPPALSRRHRPTGKKETLFLERLQKQTEALEAKQKAELASMQNLVRKKATEAQHAQATIKQKIAKLEGENKELLLRVNDLLKKITTERRRAKDALELAARHDRDKAEATATIPDLEAKLTAHKAKLAALEQAKRESEAALAQQVKDRDVAVLALQAEIATLKQSFVDAEARHQASLDDLSPLVHERDHLVSELSGLQARFGLLTHEHTHSQFRVKTLQDAKDQFEVECAGWRRKAADLLEAHEKLKYKYRLDLHEVNAEKKKIATAHRTYHKLIRMLALKAYVRNFLVRRFLFNIHLRVSEMVVSRWEERMENSTREREASELAGAIGMGADTSSLYHQLTMQQAKNKQTASAMATAAPMAGGSAPTNGSAATFASASASAAGSKLSLDPSSGVPLSHPSQLVSAYPLPGTLVGSSGGAPTVSDPLNPAATMSVFAYTSEAETQHVPKEQLRWEKKKYLLALKSKRNPPPSIAAMLQSLEDELIELATPVAEMNLTIRELRATLDAFFKRTIQLTAQLLHTKKALEVAVANYEALKASVRARHAQETSSNPFSTHLLLETTNGKLQQQQPQQQQLSSRSAAGSRTGMGSLTFPPAGVVVGGVAPSVSGDEKEPDSARSYSASSPPLSARPPSMSPPSSKRPPVDIDWAALDHGEKSSGYGVTRPMVRRESKLVHVPPGSTLARRRQSTMQPRPPSTAPAATTSAAPTSTSTAAASAAGAPAASFALPKV